MLYIDVIDEAYYNGAKNVERNRIDYELDNGIDIQINLNKNGKINSAYPVLEKR